MPDKPKRGRPKGSRTNPFADMLRIAISEAIDDKPKLRIIAEQLVEKAIGGDLAAIKEIADRLDGKPAQAIHHSGEPDEDGLPTEIRVTLVRPSVDA